MFFRYIPPNVVMCTGDGNPKPEVTIIGLYNGNDTGKEVVELEIMEKKVFWCQAHNSRGRVVSRNLIGNAAGVVLYCSFRVSNQSVLPCFPYFGCLPEDKRYALIRGRVLLSLYSGSQ